MQSANASEPTTDIAVIGGGAAGIGVIASLLKRSPGLRISLIEPADTHYYQPGWTLVGGGAYAQGDTARPMAGLVPPGVEWLRTRVERVDPEARRLLLESGGSLEYRNLIVCPGLRLAWERIEGLEETLGRNGVTSNYRYDLAPYTWELVRGLRGGKALFTQPAMPIKCAGAPQKAMYLSCDHWLREGVLQDIEVEFDLAGAALFGVADFVPPLMEYVRKYSAELAFNSNLVKVDGAARKAWFEVKDADGNTNLAEKDFDLLHVVPPQLPPTFVAASGLGDAAGWCEVDPATLQHVRHGEIFALGDVCGTANAKTAAAARKQIVVVAENLLGLRSGRGLPLRYDGYGGCPLTVERGRVVLAEFGYAGKLLPTFPLEPTAASRFAWLLKRHVLPWVYWNAMLKGREWLARPGR
ncbi:MULTISPECIES: NAD(P)/FAD-dependent oxidoreductase [Pseudomonas]|nr:MULTISPECIES: FAD/NAD(P)-binding oxidoreductase [Pseudomonas]ALY63848.1 pyridine nucleotide-disulfide oxidoreductase [Pseudomonas aeruginosa]EKU4118131.1 NAD(P)/FAD-dependent oxidoreductase [Pseudomonas aeruginosa]EKV2939774.1 NAD(P)/FAD-dependent oxidoreductase [Pseudomonas aeruginosa]ELL4384941.1 NAD(P)/FAD-dependent oxidoreductase [Pseudomonas aeruginosa]ERY72632.1 hypothetical protein Q057_00120 [Pseudomonas aeruginosa BL03]